MTESIGQIAQRSVQAFQGGDFIAAERCAKQLCNIRRDHPVGLHIRGVLALARGDRDHGSRMLERASRADPENAALHRDCARAAAEREDFDRMELHYRAAADIAGTERAKMDLALGLLLAGKWREGWERYEVRVPRELRTRRHLHALSGARVWDGSPVSGTLLIVGEAGYGDMIQFAPLARQIANAAPRVVYRVPAALQRLMTELLPDTQIATTGEPLPHFDAWALVMSLPHILKLDPPDWPTAPARAPRPRGAQDQPRVGIAWGGSPLHARDRLRSLSRDALQALLAIDAVEWHVLQQGPARMMLPELLRDLDARDHVITHDEGVGDFLGTARIMEDLDLVVTVDTSVAHLAGTLGVPTWIMLSTAPEWRWGIRGDRCRWYESARLFRQRTPAQWLPVVDQVRDALQLRFSSPTA